MNRTRVELRQLVLEPRATETFAGRSRCWKTIGWTFATRNLAACSFLCCFVVWAGIILAHDSKNNASANHEGA